MAVTITIKDIGSGDGSTKLATYTGLAETDTTPAAIEMPEWADRSVQITGTFNAGTVLIEGSNDGSNWSTLNDTQGNPLSFTATKIEQVLEAVQFMRPRVSAGAGVSVTVSIMARRTSGMRN